MIPVGLKAVLAINVLYCIVAIILVSIAAFQDTWFDDTLDQLNPDEATRRDNIEISTVVFFGISIVCSLAYFIFHNKLSVYHFTFLIIFGVLACVFIALTALQFHYDEENDNLDETKYQFTKWWPLAAVFTNVLVAFFIFRNRRNI